MEATADYSQAPQRLTDSKTVEKIDPNRELLRIMDSSGVSQEVWDEAQMLVKQQDDRCRKLTKMMQSTSKSGLYQDEQEGSDEENFCNFVDNIRQVLSRSPRTILRQALKLAVSTKFLLQSSDQKESQSFRHLCQLLEMDFSSEESFIDVARVVVGGLEEGKCFRQLQDVVRSLEELDNNNASDDMTDKIVTGFRSKRKKMNRPEPTPQEIETLLKTTETKKMERRQRLVKRGKELEKQLATSDSEYQRYTKALALWTKCGGDQLWSYYNVIDLAISRSRGHRGKDFEDAASELCFAMIALKLMTAENDDPNKFSYLLNVHWWHNGRNVGEIDMVVLNEQTGVVAICEMKNSCFEMTIAKRQHEQKLKNAQQSNGWTIGKTRKSALPLSPLCQFFIATRELVANDQVDSSPLGVEPALSNAICNGIRDQGCTIEHPSSLDLCRPLAEMMLQSCYCTQKEVGEDDDALRYLCEELPLRVRSIGTNPKATDEELDYKKLKAFVLSAMSGNACWQESPVGLFQRYHNEGKILVLSPNDLCPGSDQAHQN